MSTMYDTMYTLGMICREIFGSDPVPKTLIDTLLIRPASGLALLLKRRENTKNKQRNISELVSRLDDIFDPDGGVSIEDQGPFWLGYYHYMTAIDAAQRYGADELTAAGHALFGDRWQSDLSRELGLSDTRRIRHWMSGSRPIPVTVWADICRMLRQRQSSIDQVLQDFA